MRTTQFQLRLFYPWGLCSNTYLQEEINEEILIDSASFGFHSFYVATVAFWRCEKYYALFFRLQIKLLRGI